MVDAVVLFIQAHMSPEMVWKTSNDLEHRTLIANGDQVLGSSYPRGPHSKSLEGQTPLQIEVPSRGSRYSRILKHIPLLTLELHSPRVNYFHFYRSTEAGLLLGAQEGKAKREIHTHVRAHTHTRTH